MFSPPPDPCGVPTMGGSSGTGQEREGGEAGCPPAAGVWFRASPALVLAECPASLGDSPGAGRALRPGLGLRVSVGRVPVPLPPPALGPGCGRAWPPPCRPLRSARPRRTGEEAARAGPPGAGSSCPRPRSAPRGRWPCPRFADGGRGPVAHRRSHGQPRGKTVGQGGWERPAGPGSGLGPPQAPGAESSWRGQVPPAAAPAPHAHGTAAIGLPN